MLQFDHCPVITNQKTSTTYFDKIHAHLCVSSIINAQMRRSTVCAVELDQYSFLGVLGCSDCMLVSYCGVSSMQSHFCFAHKSCQVNFFETSLASRTLHDKLISFARQRLFWQYHFAVLFVCDVFLWPQGCRHVT